MQQFLHLLIVDTTFDAALAASSGARCLLPIIVAPDTCRIGTLVRTWVRERGIGGLPVGQWLGRASPRGAADWLVVVHATEGMSLSISSELRWVDLPALAAVRWHVEYQAWAIARLLAGDNGMSVSGPFGNPAWLHDVSDWIRDAVGQSRGASLGITPYRLSSHDVVLECATARGRWFFKGLSSRRAPEALLTGVMSELMPSLFARTAALKTRADGSVWWLMHACPGVPLTDQLTVDAGVRVVEAYAEAQQTIVRALENGRSVPMPVLDLPALSVWSADVTRDAAYGLALDCAPAVAEACDEAVWSGPGSWVAADLDPSNVIVNGRSVRFIDLDDAVVAPAPVAIAIFVRRLARAASHNGGTAWMQELVRAYEHAWNPPLDLRRQWRAIDLVSECLECWLAWQRMESKIESGEVHGVRELALPVLQQRLLRAVTRYRSVASVI